MITLTDVNDYNVNDYIRHIENIIADISKKTDKATLAGKNNLKIVLIAFTCHFR